MRWILAFLIFGGSLVLCQARAEAGVHFCNATPSPVSVAIAMRWTDAIGLDHQAVQGWFAIPAGDCQTPVPFDPTMHSLAFYYALNSHDDTWNAQAEPQSYCVNEVTRFTYWNSFQDTPCEAFAHKHKFRHVETGRTDQTVVFLAPDASLSI